LNLAEVREQIPLIADTVYFDNAGAGPPPVSVLAAMRSFLDDWQDNGERWERWLMDIFQSRALFAKLVRAKADQVACIPNVSSGLGAVAGAMQFGREQNVVVSELNFPTNVYLWHTLKERGLLKEVRVLKAADGKIPLSAYDGAIDNSTAAVSVDYVSWINGCREDVAEVTKLAHAHGALMLVDVFHAAGVLPIDVNALDVDVLVCGTYKWLMGPHGAAFLYINPESLAEFKPLIVGWHGIKDSVLARVQANEDPFGRPFDLSRAEPAGDATRFEWGTWAVISVEGAKAALEFTLNYPPEERWPLIQKLNERLADGLRRKKRRVTSPSEKERLSGIVTFEIPEAARVAKRLLEEHVVVAPRVNTLRVSPHFYNTESEIDLLLEKV
jgi:selenocysteine lyase/cysteine desulfurase